MSIYFPNNIFTRALTSCFTDNLRKGITFLPSAQITQSVLNENESVGLIPVMDLLRHKELYVSAKYGISFEESFCNSYISYNSKEKEIKKLALAGDVSSQEVILSKILFKEMYGSDIEIEILTSLDKAQDKNVLLVGDENFKEERFKKGISFSELMIDSFSLPYVNFIFASANKETLESFIKNLDGVEKIIYDKLEKEFASFSSLGPALPSGRGDKEGAEADISSFVFKLDIQDREGIEQVLRLPYFHGIVKDITEVNFVKPSS